MQWLHDQGCPRGVDVCVNAAMGGHVPALQWLRQHGCEWNSTVSLEAALNRGVATADDLAATHEEANHDVGKGLAGAEEALSKRRALFHRDLRCQLYTDNDENGLFQCTDRQLKDVEQRMEQVHAALVHLDSQLQLMACNNAGLTTGALVVLPMLQEKLDAKAADFALAKAQEAQAEILRMEEELAERRRCEQERRQRLKQKSRGKEQGATPPVGAGKEPSGEEHNASSTSSLPDLHGRPLQQPLALPQSPALELLHADSAEPQTGPDDVSSSREPGASVPGSADDHRVGSEAGGAAKAPAAEGQPGAVDSGRHGHGSSPLDVDDREPAAPAVVHKEPATPAVVLEEPAAAAVVHVSKLGSRPPAADQGDGLSGHRPRSAPQSASTGDEQPGQQPVESSAKPKPKPRPKSARGPGVTPAEPVVDFTREAELTPDQECLMCLEHPRSVALAPCGHVIACLRCADDLYGPRGLLAIERNQVCPLCRMPVRATVKRFCF